MKKILTILFCASLALYSCSDDEPANPDPDPGETVDPGDEEWPPEEGTPVNMWAIDMTPLEIDGKWYAVWSGWEDEWGPDESLDKDQLLYIAEMRFYDTAPMVRLGRRHLIGIPDQSWELKKSEDFSLIEGPQILRNPAGDIFIIYSTRGSWTVDYKMGQLKLVDRTKPLEMASWQKSGPVFKGIYVQDQMGWIVRGVGHASFTTSPDGTENWIYYHIKRELAGGWDDRCGLLKKFTFGADGNPDFGIPPDTLVPVQRPSGEIQIEKNQMGIANPSPTFLNPITEGSDPWITYHDGYYYTCRSIERGIWVTKSRFMTKFENANGEEVSWREARRKVWTPPDKDGDKWNRVQHWAPELHRIEGKWYIFYAAGQQTEAPYWQHRAGVLVYDGDDPWKTNCFEEHDTEPLFTGEYR